MNWLVSLLKLYPTGDRAKCQLSVALKLRKPPMALCAVKTCAPMSIGRICAPPIVRSNNHIQRPPKSAMSIINKHREKKVGNINVHVTPTVELAIRRLSESVGVSASSYLSQIIELHIQEKQRQLTILRAALEGDSSISSERAP